MFRAIFQQGSRYYQVKCGRLDLTVSITLAGLGQCSEDRVWFAWGRRREKVCACNCVCPYLFCFCCINASIPVYVICVWCNCVRALDLALLLCWIMSESSCVPVKSSRGQIWQLLASHIAVTVWCASPHLFAWALPWRSWLRLSKDVCTSLMASHLLHVFAWEHVMCDRSWFFTRVCVCACVCLFLANPKTNRPTSVQQSNYRR